MTFDRLQDLREQAATIRSEMNRILGQIDHAIDGINENGALSASKLSDAARAVVPLQGRAEKLFDSGRRYQELRWRAVEFLKKLGLDSTSENLILKTIDELDRR